MANICFKGGMCYHVVRQEACNANFDLHKAFTFEFEKVTMS